ncbi:hypothetical protein ACLB1G_12495 [Oxalobacteraceae bacterium A2-2]
MNDEDLKQLWQSQPAAAPHFDTAALRRRAAAMQRRVGLRNLAEYLAGVAVLACFGFYIWAFPAPLVRIGSALVMAATLLVLFQLRRRASRRALPADSGAVASREFHRAQLRRQRDALRSAWRWYVAPYVPGLILFRWGVESQLAPGAPFARGLAANLLIAVVLLAVILVNRRAANQLQRELDRMEREDGGQENVD